MSKIKKISDFKLNSKKVLVRLDLNLPIKNSKILDDSRVKAALPTINHIVKKKGIPIIISHFGRPEGKENNKFSLNKIRSCLSRHLKKKVVFCQNCIGPEVKKTLENVSFGQVVLLENLRFHKGETTNNNNFAKKLTKYCDIYINDAFSSSHRKHASIDKVAKLLPSGIGINLEKELYYLNKLLKKPKKPIIAIIGGAKMENKINLLKSLVEKSNYLILGGGVANTFLKSNNINIGKSIFEKNQLANVIKIQKNAKKKNCKIILPVDVVVSEKNRNIDILKINKNHQVFDLGKNTISEILKIINNSRTLVWSGPLGYFEKKPFDKSTNKIATFVNSKKKLVSVAGGGDTLAALKKNKNTKNFSFLSTGGGAFLHWLENFTLPGVDVLKKN